MAVKYGKFELPSKVKIEETPDQEHTCRIIAEPLERGFGHTLGNALRRVMLTSIEAPAILSFTMDDVFHEYMSLDGIVEDITHIILNLKTACLRKLPKSDDAQSRAVQIYKKNMVITQQILDDNNGQYAFTVGDLFQNSPYEVMNPELKIFTVTKPMEKNIVCKIGIGRGYVPSERQELAHKEKNEICLDAIFSPVRRVNYFVENCRVGGETDMDRLVFDIQTDGRISPREAFTFATQLTVDHFAIFTELQQEKIVYEAKDDYDQEERDAFINKLCLKIDEIELSVRSTNCLAQANIETIAELIVIPEQEMLKFRNFGKKSLNEIKAKLKDMNLQLGLDLTAYGVTRENAKEKVQEFIKLRKEGAHQNHEA